MRIGIIAPPWVPVPPPGYGGTETVLDGLARGLVAAGHEVLLYATGDSSCPVETAYTYANALGIAEAPPTAELRHAVDAYDAIASWSADVVHDHTVVGPLYGAAVSAAPVVTTNHGPFDSDLEAFYRMLSRRVPIVAISNHQASVARDIQIRAVIHHGIDVDRFAPGPGDGGYALFLGRMCPEKGVHDAVDIARRAGLPLKIAAKMREPRERAYFDELVAPKLGHDVEFLGEVGSVEKTALLRHALCLLNPLQWAEPFGMVMIESLACGTPVVASDRGSVPEIVRDGITGFVRTGNTHLARALAEVSSLSRDDCRADAVARFSTERMVADHVALYRSLVDDGAEPRGAAGYVRT